MPVLRCFHAWTQTGHCILFARQQYLLKSLCSLYKGDKEVYVKFNWKSTAEGPQYFDTDKDAQMAGEPALLV